LKIIFVGCSFTWGLELGERREEQRFSRLVCDELGAEEINISRCGWSNDMILHNFLKQPKADVAVIQWSSISRWQVWNDNSNEWELLLANEKIKRDKDSYMKGNMFYRYIYNFRMGIESFWKNVYIAEQYCKENNIKLIGINKSNDILKTYTSQYEHLCNYKAKFIKGNIIPVPKENTPEWYEYWMKDVHPSPKGHRKIADYIINNFDYFQ
jgi:hypothetical protein